MSYTEQDFYHLAESLAIQYFNKYKSFFTTRLLMDFDDVRQEAFIVVVKLLNNKKLSGVTLPLVKKSVGWRMTQLLGNYINLKGGLKTKCLPINEDYQTSTHSPTKLPLFNSYRSIINATFSLPQLRQILTDKQYQILSQRLVECLTYEEIGNKMGMSRQAIQQAYSKILKKIKLQLFYQEKNS